MSSSTIFEPSASLTELAYRQMLLNISEVSDTLIFVFVIKEVLPCDFSALLSWKVLLSALIQTIKCWAVHTHGLQEKFSLTIHPSSDQLCRLFFIRLNLHLYLQIFLYHINYWGFDHAYKFIRPIMRLYSELPYFSSFLPMLCPRFSL